MKLRTAKTVWIEEISKWMNLNPRAKRSWRTTIWIGTPWTGTEHIFCYVKITD